MSKREASGSADLAAESGDAGEIELRGTLATITFRNEENGYTVARLDVEGATKPVTAVGAMPGVNLGDPVLLRGRWITHPSYGRQLEVRRCELRLPSGRSGLIRYLDGRLKGVGPATAEKIVDTLGLDVLEKLERQPALLATVPGISRPKAQAILEQLHEQREAAAALVFLQEYGLGPALALRTWRRFRHRTVDAVRDNPWRLADEVSGIGFRTADALAQRLGHAPDSPKRLAAGLLHLLGQAALEGHTGLPVETLLEHGTAFLESDEAPLREVLEQAVGDGRLAEDGLVYHPELLRAEREVASGLRMLLADPRPLVNLAADVAVGGWQVRAKLELAPDQRRAVELALRSRVAVITGGPGVGKTTIVRCLLDVLIAQSQRVALAAPTGRAARRLAEATGDEAATLHRLLGLVPGAALGARRNPPGGAEDEGGAAEPLELDVLIIDEVSMVDVVLMAQVLEALPPGAGLVLVGDVDQLPSVGPGEVLRSFIESGVLPVARLTTIFRQSELSGIVRVAHELNSGEEPSFDEGPEGQAFFVERATAPEVVETVRGMVVERIPQRFQLDPLRDVQVLTPMHGGPLGTVALNEALREALNPPAPGRAELSRFGKLFRTGDKLMQVKNNYELNVFNGDIGVLAALDLEGEQALVDFDDRRVEYPLDSLDQLEPAFAITCHKSQGSEFRAVVLPLVSAHFMMLRRNLVYTAFTRARDVLVVVGQRRALQTAAATLGSGQRHGRLTERLRGEA
ncbi:MAG: SF1B family DNA helicase RecD2 [Planctomycetota bacterium]